jgi:uncharacterized membrane protein YbhN (UPF0104 family)
VLKVLLTVAILFAIGRQFAHALRIPELGLKPALSDLWAQLVHPAWLILAGGLYLLGLGFSAIYWYVLLRATGQSPSLPGALRAHYIGQMGKYLPGKAWALILRSGILRGHGVQVSVAIATSFYEVFATMAVGALLAAVLFTLQISEFTTPPDWAALRQTAHLLNKDLHAPDPALTQSIDPKLLALLSLALALPLGVVLVPPVFNKLAQRLARPFRDAGSAELPAIPLRALPRCLLTFGCWVLMGASLWAVLQAVMVSPPGFDLGIWQRCTAYASLAYVGSFVILIVPSGLGVREFLLLLLLTPEICRLPGLGETAAQEISALTILLLRLVWTAAEVVLVAMIYWLPVPSPGGGAANKLPPDS